MNRRRITETTLILPGLGLFLCGMLKHLTDVRSVGVLLFMLGVLALLLQSADRKASTSRSADYELGYRHGDQQGERRGYAAGRRVARPVVVPFRARYDDSQAGQVGQEGTA